MFDLAAVINLDRRPDRWEAIEPQLAALRCPAVRVSAVDGRTIGEAETEAYRARRKCSHRFAAAGIGCVRSHRLAIGRAIDAGAETALILEDDAVIPPDLYDRLYLDELPGNWRLLHLGAIHHARPVRHSAHWVRPREAHSSHAYVLRGRFMQGRMRQHLREESDSIDMAWRGVMRAWGYCASPLLIPQAGGYSDVVGRSYDPFADSRVMRFT